MCNNMEKYLGDYFDKIYVINLLERKDRREFIINELIAWGIYDRLVSENKIEIIEAIKLHWVREPIIKAINDNGFGSFYSYGVHNVGLYNCTCEHYKIIKRSLLKGYNRILIIEDDACFLKNYKQFLNAIENAPENFKILHLEGYLWPNMYPSWDEALSVLSDKIEDAEWKSSEYLPLWATGALIYSSDGMKYYTESQERYAMGVDYYTCALREGSYFYSFPLVRQEDKKTTLSDIAANYSNEYEKTNVYLAKSDRNLYYHMEDFNSD